MTTPAGLTQVRRTALPGALDRWVLASSIEFALTSVRRGSARRLGVVLPWFDGEGLVWHQSTWVQSISPEALHELPLAQVAEYGSDPRLAELTAEAPDCGTACCIAGWIELHSPGYTGMSDDPPETATGLLLGYAQDDLQRALRDDREMDLPGLPDGLAAWVPLSVLNGELFGALNVLLRARGEDDDTLDEAFGDGYLFSGGNDLRDLFSIADRLLELYGEEPLRIGPDGTVW